MDYRVQQDISCDVCSKLCKTLSKCFHTLYCEHFNGLTKCPSCGDDLKDCKTLTDARLGRAIAAIEELSQMFEPSGRTEQTSAAKVNNDLRVNTLKDNTTGENSKSKIQNSLIGAYSTSVNKRIRNGQTILHLACKKGKRKKIVELLNQGANTNTKDDDDLTPLHDLIENGRFDLVQLLLQNNTLINVPGQWNETPLHLAVRYKCKRITKELVKCGANIDARNSVGETPLLLASSVMKDILITTSNNVCQVQSVNIIIDKISLLHSKLDMENMKVYCSSQYRTVFNKLKKLSKHHNNLHIETEWSEEVTHLIVDTENGVCQTSLYILEGIVSAIWILSSEWVIKSTIEKLEPLDDYEVSGVNSEACTGPKNARYNKYKMFPGLFDGCFFYLHDIGWRYKMSNNIVLTRNILMKLINYAGGAVIESAPIPGKIPNYQKSVPYHANKGGKLFNCSHYIIFTKMWKPMYNLEYLKALPISWLIECIEKYELRDP